MLPDILKQTEIILESTVKQAQKAVQTVDQIGEELNKEPELERLIVLCKNITYKVEKLALTVRKLPLDLAMPYNAVDVPTVVGAAFDFKAGFLKQNWFYMDIPPLAKKKDLTTSTYMKYSVQMLLRKYFSEYPIDKKPKYEHTDLIYINVIDQNKNIRRVRDNDNLEYNSITNAIATYLLPDDGPFVCNEHHYAKTGDNDRTLVLLIPHDAFSDFLQMFDSGALNSCF